MTIITLVRDARVVELADSLDSGSSVHYARAGSSPASRTNRKTLEAARLRGFFLFHEGTSKNGSNCGRESAVRAVFYAFSFSSSSWTNIMRKLIASRPQDSQIAPVPQWRVAMLPIPAPSANSSTTPK